MTFLLLTHACAAEVYRSSTMKDDHPDISARTLVLQHISWSRVCLPSKLWRQSLCFPKQGGKAPCGCNILTRPSFPLREPHGDQLQWETLNQACGHRCRVRGHLGVWEEVSGQGQVEYGHFLLVWPRVPCFSLLN